MRYSWVFVWWSHLYSLGQGVVPKFTPFEKMAAIYPFPLNMTLVEVWNRQESTVNKLDILFLGFGKQEKPWEESWRSS